MIIITQKYDHLCKSSHVKSVWQIEDFDGVSVRDSYLKFMLKKAKEMDIVINPHWLNVMDYERHNSHLSEGQFKSLSNKWERTLKYWTYDRHISENLGGKKVKFEVID